MKGQGSRSGSEGRREKQEGRGISSLAETAGAAMAAQSHCVNFLGNRGSEGIGV